MVNRLNTTVAVAAGSNHLEYLVDKDLNNGTKFISGVKAELITEPSYTIRDVKHTYAAGTTAGFVVTLNNSVLQLKVVDLPMRIFFYKDGQRIGSVPCQQKSGSLLQLKLASFNSNTFEFTAVAPADFDEIGIGYAEGLKADVIDYMTVKYAFVGKNGKYFIDRESTNGIEAFKAAVEKNYPGTVFSDDKLTLGQCITDMDKTPSADGKTIDADTTNSVLIVTDALVPVITPVTVSAYGGNDVVNLPFKKGMTVGFETAGAGILNVGAMMKLRPYVMTVGEKTELSGKKKTTYDWKKQKELNGEFTLLGLDLGGGRKDVVTTLKEDCNAVELVSASILGVGATVAYRMFVILPPSIDEDDTLKVSADRAICEDVKTVTLSSNRPVSWTYSPSDANLKLTADESRKAWTVSGFKNADTYTFTATDDTTGVTRTTKVTYGVDRLYDTATQPWVNNFTDPDVTYHVMTEKEMKAVNINGFSLIHLSKTSNKENLVNGSIDDYMSFTGGLQLAGKQVIVGIKRSKPLHLYKDSRVGFVLRFQDTYLNVDLINSMKVYAYNSGSPCTEISRRHNFKVLKASIGGHSDQQTTEFNVELRGGQDVDELLLCYNSTLDIDLNDIRVYYAYSEAEDDIQKFEESQANHGEIVSYNDGARIDEAMLGGFQGVASIASLKNGYTNFIDGDQTTALTITNSVEAAGKFNVIPVKLGKIYSGNHLVEVCVGNMPGLAKVDLGSVFKLDAYYQGKKVASKTNWNAVDATVIGAGGDYSIRWTPNADFDEIVVSDAGVAKLLNIEEKFYGMRIYSDADGDGVPDYEDDESCPDVAFLLDENQASLDKVHDFTHTKMYLHRSFAKDKWTTICLPVDITYNQFASVFGSDARLATPAAFRKETPNRVQFYIDKVYGNEVLLHKNVPYIIKVDQITNETVPTTFAADNAETGTLAEEKDNNLTMLNNIVKKDGYSVAEGNCYFIRGVSYDMDRENGKVTLDTVAFNHNTCDIWQMNRIAWHGTFVSPQKISCPFYTFLLKPKDESADAEMVHVNGGVDFFRGLRCWLTANDPVGKSAQQLSLAVADEVITSGAVTGLDDVTETPHANGDIYNMAGVLVKHNATSTEGLRKGIYIWNNKKIVIK